MTKWLSALQFLLILQAYEKFSNKEIIAFYFTSKYYKSFVSVGFVALNNKGKECRDVFCIVPAPSRQSWGTLTRFFSEEMPLENYKYIRISKKFSIKITHVFERNQSCI